MKTKYSYESKNWPIIFLAYLFLANAQARAFDFKTTEYNRFPEFDQLGNKSLIEDIFPLFPEKEISDEISFADFNLNTPIQSKLIEELYAELSIASDDRCLANYSPDNPRMQSNSNVRLLPQTSLENVFKGIYDYSQNAACFVEPKEIIATNPDENQAKGNGQKLYEFPLLLADDKITKETLPTNKVESPKSYSSNNNFDQGMSRLEDNTVSLNLIGNLASKAPQPKIYTTYQEPFNKQQSNNFLNEQQYLNYISASKTTYGELSKTNTVSTNIVGNSPTIALSPIQQKINEDLAKRQEQLREKQKQQQEQAQKRIQQQRQQQQRREEQRLRQLKQKQQQQQQQAQEKMKQQQQKLIEQQTRR